MLDFQRYSGANRHAAIINEIYRFISLTKEFAMQYRAMLIFESSLCQWVPFSQSGFPVILQHSSQCEVGKLWRIGKSGMETDFLIAGVNHHNLLGYLSILLIDLSTNLGIKASVFKSLRIEWQAIVYIQNSFPSILCFFFYIFAVFLEHSELHQQSGNISNNSSNPLWIFECFPIALVEEVASHVIDTRVTHGNNPHRS